MTIDTTHMVLGQDFSDIRAAVSRICEDYPGEYWRELDAARGYPVAFVKALTESGFLGCLIPEAYGGTGLSLRAAAVILETIHAAGCSAAACHAQMYTMGTVLRHGSEAQKQAYLPAIAKGELRLQAFGVTEPTSGTDTTRLRTRAVREGDHYRVNGQKIWTSRALHSDLMLLLARTSAREDVEKPSQGLSVFLIDLRELKGNGIEIRPIDTMINHNTTEVFFDQALIPADTLIGEEGRGFRYILDGMNAERILIAERASVMHATFCVAHLTMRVSGRFSARLLGLIRVFSSRWHGPTPRPRRQSLWRARRPLCSKRVSRVAQRPTWPNCCVPKRHGMLGRHACKPLVDSPSHASTTLSVNGVRRDCI